MRRLAILGTTGSIGRAALDVAERFPDQLQVVGVSAFHDMDSLRQIITRWSPRAVACSSPSYFAMLQPVVSPTKEVYFGQDGLARLASREDVDLVLIAVVGIAGLVPALEALKRGKIVALATKEALVAGGKLILDAAMGGKGTLLPVDSEHSAIFQCLKGEELSHIRRVIITASGGPFRTKSREELEKVTVQETLAHPVWRMGPKISTDSATLMNKGLEIIEAHHLFRLTPAQIEVVLHPQSIVHSLVEFCDCSVLAQLSWPDMRLPIQYALLYPERLPSLVSPLDLVQTGRLEFGEIDRRSFPAIDLAYQALKIGGTMPAVLSAADEVAVRLFLQGKIPFVRIVDLVQKVLERHKPMKGDKLDQIIWADQWARAELHSLAQDELFKKNG